MSDTNDGRGDGYTDPTAPSHDDDTSSPPPATPPTTEIPRTPPSDPATPAPAPDAAPEPWAAPPAYGQPPTYGQPPAYGQQPTYGQPPAYGQPAPYGEQPPAAGQDPYAQQAYGYAPSPYAAPGTYGQPAQSNANALTLTIISGITTVACCLFTAPALIFGIMALTKHANDPVGSARMTRYGWIAFAASFALGLVAVGIFIAFGVSGAFDDPTTYDGL